MSFSTSCLVNVLFTLNPLSGSRTTAFTWIKNEKSDVMRHTNESLHHSPFPVSISLFKVNKRNTRTGCEICSKLIIKAPERRQWRRSGVFIINFEHISHLVLVFLLLTLRSQMPTGLIYHGNLPKHNQFKFWARIREIIQIIRPGHVWDLCFHCVCCRRSIIHHYFTVKSVSLIIIGD